MQRRSLDVYRASMRTASRESLVHRLSGGPASLFGMVLGMEGLASAWRVAERSWNIRSGAADALGTLAATLWCALLALYAMKWLLRPRDALAELEHPVQCCFVGLVGVATMLVGVSITPSMGTSTGRRSAPRDKFTEAPLSSADLDHGAAPEFDPNRTVHGGRYPHVQACSSPSAWRRRCATKREPPARPAYRQRRS